MTNAVSTQEAIASQIMSLEDFLNYDDGTDTRYELEDGRLRVMTGESDRNQRIASLFICLFSPTGDSLAQLSVGIASQLLSELGNGSSLTAIQVLQGTNQ